MRYVALPLAIALQLTIPFAATVSAQTTAGAAQSGQHVSGMAPQPPQTVGAQTTVDGRQFGEHVSGMAPEHPQTHGQDFGECVSELAITGECPHHELE
jgi:hypothetical protein